MAEKIKTYALTGIRNEPGNWFTRALTTSEEVAKWWKGFPREDHILERDYWEVDPRDQKMATYKTVETVHDLIDKEYFVTLANTNEQVPTDSALAEGGIRISGDAILTWQRVPEPRHGRSAYSMRILVSDLLGVYGHEADMTAWPHETGLTLEIACTNGPQSRFMVMGKTVDAMMDIAPAFTRIIGMLGH